MLTIQNMTDFKRIAYAFMSVFSNIEAVTLSSDGANKSIDFWKTTNIEPYYGVYSCGRPRYEQVRGGISTRNRRRLIADCLIKSNCLVNMADTAYYIDRSNVLFPFKYNNSYRYIYCEETKRHLECIANLMKLKKINIGYNNRYTFIDDENTTYSMSMRGANGNIYYKGDILY